MNKRILALVMASLLLVPDLLAFCGFYVARAGAELFNQRSEVILARQNGETVVTMSNDFQGDVKDFAIVVPVPVVLKREQIKVVNGSIFQKLDAYSGPRLVEYYDSPPCQVYQDDFADFGANEAASMAPRSAGNIQQKERDLGVTVEAVYNVGEYTINILSATNSRGLKTYLTENGYALPPAAEEVLEPYIKSDMKFFVVKVNLEKAPEEGFEELRPIQIRYASEKFMLPIRLGMANSKGFQDLIVYALSERGRVEPVNYPIMPMPTDYDVPENIEATCGFGNFYKATFEHAWEKAGKRSMLLEYAWDLSSSNYTHCDPCNTTPPTHEELSEAGVFWLKKGGEGSRPGCDYTGDLFITRMHVRYNRELYPEDLQFHTTPNQQNFQCRYVIHHRAEGPFDCEAGQRYLRDYKQRKQKEQENLAYLTNWNGPCTQPGQTPGSGTDGRGGLPVMGGGSDEPGGPNPGIGEAAPAPEANPLLDASQWVERTVYANSSAQAPAVFSPAWADPMRWVVIGVVLLGLVGLIGLRRRHMRRNQFANA